MLLILLFALRHCSITVKCNFCSSVAEPYVPTTPTSRTPAIHTEPTVSVMNNQHRDTTDHTSTATSTVFGHTVTVNSTERTPETIIVYQRVPISKGMRTRMSLHLV